MKYKLDLVCRKRAVSNSRPACQKAFLKFVALLVFTRDMMNFSCYVLIDLSVTNCCCTANVDI